MSKKYTIQIIESAFTTPNWDLHGVVGDTTNSRKKAFELLAEWTENYSGGNGSWSGHARLIDKNGDNVHMTDAEYYESIWE